MSSTIFVSRLTLKTVVRFKHTFLPILNPPANVLGNIQPSPATAMSHQSAQTTKHSNPPNQTLYINNLNDKIAKHDLRRALYMLFSTHGPVLDVVALKTRKMRGQAHIVFQNKVHSQQAMETLQGCNFLGKEMVNKILPHEPVQS